MKEKFLQFFTGKLSKSIYIAVASAVMCGVAVVTTVVVVHNNNQKLDTALESLNEQTATMAQTESATEDVSVTEGNNNTTTPAQAANNEPAGDRALEYIAEYERITAEYEKKRAELEKAANKRVVAKECSLSEEPSSRAAHSEETSEEYAAYLQTYQELHKQWEAESQRADELNRVEQSKADALNAKSDEAKKQLTQLEQQYEEDVASLKARYGIL